MEYISDININESILHVLDSSGIEPILNEFKLDLNEDTYKFLYKHIEKCLNNEELKYAKFNREGNIVKEITQDFLNGIDNNLIELSKEISRQLFGIMKGNCNIPSCDLIVNYIITDQGPMIAILKMDYVKNFTHKIDFYENEIGIGIVPQSEGLPASTKRIEKAAFIKPLLEDDMYNIMVLDKQKRVKEDEDYGSNYWINNLLGCTLVTNERDNTKSFINSTENWIRKVYTEDAERAETIRSAIKDSLDTKESININEIAEEILIVQGEADNYKLFMAAKCDEEFSVDRIYTDKKLKRTRLKIDKEIDLYIDKDAYHDKSKFEVVKNGDGSINLVIKNVINYTEK